MIGFHARADVDVRRTHRCKLRRPLAGPADAQDDSSVVGLGKIEKRQRAVGGAAAPRAQTYECAREVNLPRLKITHQHVAAISIVEDWFARRRAAEPGIERQNGVKDWCVLGALVREIK